MHDAQHDGCKQREQVSSRFWAAAPGRRVEGGNPVSPRPALARKRARRSQGQKSCCATRALSLQTVECIWARERAWRAQSGDMNDNNFADVPTARAGRYRRFTDRLSKTQQAQVHERELGAPNSGHDTRR